MSHHGTNDTNDSIAAQMDEEEPYHGSVAEGVIESSRRLAVGGGQVNALQRTPTTGLAGVDHQLGGGLNLRGRYSSVSEGGGVCGAPAAVTAGRVCGAYSECASGGSNGRVQSCGWGAMGGNAWGEFVDGNGWGALDGVSGRTWGGCRVVVSCR